MSWPVSGLASSLRPRLLDHSDLLDSLALPTRLAKAPAKRAGRQAFAGVGSFYFPHQPHLLSHASFDHGDFCFYK